MGKCVIANVVPQIATYIDIYNRYGMYTLESLDKASQAYDVLIDRKILVLKCYINVVQLYNIGLK